MPIYRSDNSNKIAVAIQAIATPPDTPHNEVHFQCSHRGILTGLCNELKEKNIDVYDGSIRYTINDLKSPINEKSDLKDIFIVPLEQAIKSIECLEDINAGSKKYGIPAFYKKKSEYCLLLGRETPRSFKGRNGYGHTNRESKNHTRPYNYRPCLSCNGEERYPNSA